MRVTVREICAFLGEDIAQNIGDRAIQRVAEIGGAGQDAVVFASDERALRAALDRRSP